MDRLKEILIGMGIDEKSIPEPSVMDTGTDSIKLKDADTVSLPDSTLRLQGINTRESAKFLPGKIKGAQLGADTQSELVADTIKGGGFTTPEISGKKDIYGRDLGDLYSGGRALTDELLYKGYTDLYKENTPTQRTSEAYGKLDRRQRELEAKTTIADEMYSNLIGEMYPNEKVYAKLRTTTSKQFNQADFDYFVGPSLVRPDEDERGVTNTNFSTGLSIGGKEIKKGLFGTLEMIGDRTGADWLRDIGSANVRSVQDNLEKLPYLKQPEAFDDNCDWKLDTLGKVIDFSIGQAAVSAPQLLTTVVSTLASPLTFGVSMAIPAGIYIGNTWNNQKEENKNATAAIISGLTQTALDKLSIGFMFKPGLDLTKQATQQIVKRELMLKGIGNEAADQLIKNSLKEATKEVGEALRVATIKSNLGPKAIAKSAGVGGLTESVTESLQELASYLGEEVTLSLPTDTTERNKLNNRLLNAAVGGGLLGGVMSGGSTAVSTLTNRISPTEVTSDTAFREKLIKERNGYIPSAAELQLEALNKSSVTPSIEELALLETSKRQTEGVFAKTGSWWADKGIASLFGRYSGTIMKGMQHVDEYMGSLATFLGYGRPVNGRSIDEHQALLSANIFSNFGTKEEMLSKFNGLNETQINSLFNDKKVIEGLERISSNMNLYPDQTSNQLANSLGINFGVNNQYKEQLAEYAGKITNLIKGYNNATGSDLTFKSFLEQSPIDKTIISKKYKEFLKDLEVGLKLTPKEAGEIVNSLMNNKDNSSIDDVFNDDINPFTEVTAGLKDKDVLKKALNEPENRARFAKYLSNDLLNNAYSLSNKAAAINVNKNIIGKDGSKLAALIQASLDKGTIDDKTASFIAKELKDFLSMRSGNFHPITNPYIKGALGTVNFLSTITSLPLAAVSSTVEFAQVFRNLNKEQSIKALRVLLTSSGKEMSAYLRDIGNAMTDRVQIKEVAHRSALSRAGYLREGNTAARVDIMSSYYQQWTEGFFKLTGLTSVTTITRNARLSIAADAINNWLNVVQNNDLSYSEQQVNDARDHLVRLGVDINFMTSINEDTKLNKTKFDNNMQLATYNFVNEAVVMPSTLNRPKFYSDPYYSLFTQFQGYTSAFTANLLPRLIGDLGKAGSEDQKNAAATIAMMFALSMLALYIKDLIKYGESPPEWLKDEKQFQRLVAQTGVLGTGQRIWDTMDPLIPDNSKYKGIYAQAWQNLSEQSAQISFINKIENALSAPEGKRIERGAKLLPIVGTSPAFAKYLQKELGD
jgi:hypothetical protein